MKKSYIAGSLAGTEEKYVLIQARIKGENIKFQGLGPLTNREYGFTEEISAEDMPMLTAFIKSATTED